MSDRLESGLAWLATQIIGHRARTVTYVRAGASAQVPAATGKTVFRLDTGYGLFEHVETHDYLIAVADLVDFGEPQAGDRIKDVLNGQVEVFEVMAPSGEPHFKYCDPYRRMFRIHTKYVGPES